MSQIQQRFRERDDVALRIAFDADLAEIRSQSPTKLEHPDDVDGPNAEAITAASRRLVDFSQFHCRVGAQFSPPGWLAVG